jgi:glutamate racemase
VDVLAARGLLNSQVAAGSVRLLATDGPERFARVGAVFLGHQLAAGDVEIVDLPLAAVPA